MKVSARLSENIQKAIDEFSVDPEFSPDLRKAAVEINVLPLAFDWTAAWGLQTNGDVILFNHNKPYELEAVDNQKIINMVLFRAAQKYPTLEELMPVRNAESIICPGCDGTGICKEFAGHEQLSKAVACNCGGVGWLPGSDEKYLYF